MPSYTEQVLVLAAELPQQTMATQADVTRAIIKAIKGGYLPEGSKLPSIRDLATSFGVTTGVVRRVFEQMTAQGWLETKDRCGTFVSKSSRFLIDACPEIAGFDLNTLKEAQSLSDRDCEPPRQASLSFAPSQISPSGQAENANSFLEFKSHPARLAETISFNATSFINANYTGDKWRTALDRWVEQYAKQAQSLSDPAGLIELREHVARWLRNSRGIECTADNVVITDGAQEGRFILGRMFLNRETKVVVEEPTSAQSKALLNNFEASLLPISVDDSGPAMEELQALSGARLYWTSPTGQFPTGAFFSRRRKEQIIEWAKKNDVLIVEDEPCADFTYESRISPSIAGLDGLTRTIYVGSLASLLPSDWQLGFMIVPDAAVMPIVRCKSLMNRCTSPILQWLAVSLFDTGFFEQRIRFLQRLLCSRRETMLRTIGAWRFSGLIFSAVKAGLFQTIWLPPGVDDLEVAQLCKELNVQVTPISPFFLRPPARAGLLLNFGSLEEELIEKGLQCVELALSEIMK
jgi:GntR family transcriptional regulator/MocR family aminotransferase